MAEDLVKVVDEIQDDIQRKNYEKYYYLFEIAINFLKKEKVLLYGGTAINSIFPAKSKFYKTFELPDIDMFSTNAKDLAEKLAEEYRKIKPIKHTAQVRPALHHGTYKVFINSIPVADLTDVSPEFFNTIYKGHMMGDLDIPVPDIEYLRMTLYGLLSQPMDSIRWVKVFERLTTLNRLFPLRRGVVSKAPKIKSAPGFPVSRILDYLKGKPYIIFAGRDALNRVANAGGKKLSTVYSDNCVYILIKKEHFSKTVKDIHKDLNTREMPLERGEIHPTDDFVQEHASIRYNGERVLNIFSTGDLCLNYVEGTGSESMLRIGTIHTIIRMLYSMRFSRYSTIPIDQLDYLIYTFVSIQKSKKFGAKSGDKAHLAQFVIECHGDQPGLITMKQKK